MPNIQALSKIEANLRIIEQNRKALTWLQDYRNGFNNAATSFTEESVSRRDIQAFKIRASTYGSGLPGFPEAERLINEHLKAQTAAILDIAINTAYINIQNSVEEIRKWGAEL